RGGQPEELRKGRGQRGAEAPDPVGRGRRLSPGRRRKDVGIPGVVGEKRQHRKQTGEKKEDADSLADEPALAERCVAQAAPLWGGKRDSATGRVRSKPRSRKHKCRGNHRLAGGILL